MNNKHNNNAISDDALENVSGGFSSTFIPQSPVNKFNLTPTQIKTLDAAGIQITLKHDPLWGRPGYVFKNSKGQEVRDNKIWEILLK